MAQLAFGAYCGAGHDRIRFTDRAAFDAHMKDAHKKRKPSPATSPGPRVGGLPASYLTPRKAPKGTEGLTRVLQDLAAGKYDLPGLCQSDPRLEQVA